MPPFINIQDRGALVSYLEKLSHESKPQWGNMSPPEMLEHLIEQVVYTNGTKQATLDVSETDAAAGKAAWIYTDLRIPRNLVLPGFNYATHHADLDTTKTQLLAEIDKFFVHFEQPGLTEIHGGFGALDRDEWINWHNKHFTHHFEQFGLL